MAEKTVAEHSGPGDLWGERTPPAPGETHRLAVGPLAIWIRGVQNELWVAHSCADPWEPAPEELPDAAEWSRWAMRDEPHRLRVLPVFPDRPLVVKPEHPFTLLRRAHARVYMRVPPWVRLEVVAGHERSGAVLTEIPTERLSDTWWGDFQDGELAYWLRTKARRELREELFEPHLVMSTLQLENHSEDALRVEKLSLRVEHLSIYEKDGWLWAEEVRVEYRGEDEGSDIHMDDHPPREAEGARELTPARAQARSFRARTFARLRALSGLGL
jgi:hypothetical protein